jgi:Fe-S-cluster containining protein
VDRIVLLWGKIRRFYRHFACPGYVRENLSRRRGECKRCGACCKLGHICPYLDLDKNGLALCKVYPRRSKNCRLFPIDERDIADRDIIMPEVCCGYTFTKRGEGG